MTNPDPHAPLAAEAVAERVKEVLAQTEIVHLSPGHDVVYTPAGGWDLHGAPEDMVFTQGLHGGVASWELAVPEETFWGLVLMFLGPKEVAEMKDYVSALADWEGDGGSCLS